MKKQSHHSFFAGILVALLAVGLVGSAYATVGKKTLEVEYNDLSVNLDGSPLTLTDANGNTVEPFIYNGTTYLPVRAISNALGLGVEYVQTKYPPKATIFLTSPSGSDSATSADVQLMGFYKILEENLLDLEQTFDSIVSGSLSSFGDTKLQEGPYKGMTLYEAGAARIDDNLSLVEGHYSNCSTLLSSSDIALMTEYRRLAGVAKNAYEVLGKNPSPTATSNIVGAATQNYVDCMVSASNASSAFWVAYKSSFN